MRHTSSFVDMDTKELLFFLDACRRGDADDVAQMCSAFPQLINAADAKGFTPLIIAAYNNHTGVVQYLLEHGAAADAADRSGNTALMGAAFKGYAGVADVLLQHGADVHVRNGQGATALTFAATFGQVALAKKLLAAGADASVPDSRGKTPIDHARIQEHEAMLQLLTGAHQ